MGQFIETIRRAVQYGTGHQAEFSAALGEHLVLVSLALLAAMLVSLPLGVLTSRSRTAALVGMNLVNGLRVIPSLAVLFLLIPLLGLNSLSAGVALIVLAMPPILINTDAAFRGVSPAVKESAVGVGMTAWQVFWKIEFPLALPVILAGIRTAAVEVIASATLAAFVGSGGLGIYITRGFALYDVAILLVGAVPAALLSLAAEAGFELLQKVSTPPGLALASR